MNRPAHSVEIFTMSALDLFATAMGAFAIINIRDALASTFVYKNMSVIDTDGFLGKLEWTRVSANTPERDQRKGR